MYEKLQSCVKISKDCINSNIKCDSYSSFFPCNIGTRQGDKTSATIFILYIDELYNLLKENNIKGIFINENFEEIVCLMFADDIANFAETVVNLQQHINVIESFCESTGMEVNLNKTKIMVFRNGGTLSGTIKGNKLVLLIATSIWV
jgi:hypothetical protein